MANVGMTVGGEVLGSAESGGTGKSLSWTGERLAEDVLAMRRILKEQHDIEL